MQGQVDTYTTCNKRKRDNQIESCVQHTTIYRQRDTQIERRRRQVQVDVYNIEQWIDSQIVRQRGGGGGRYRQMYTTQINRQIERQLQREVEEVGTGRCIQHRTIDRQRDSQVEKRRRQVQVDVYNIEQWIDREIVRQRGGGGGGRKIYMYTTLNNIQIERQ